MGFFKKVSSSGINATGNKKQRQNNPSSKKISSVSRENDATARGTQRKRASNSSIKSPAPKKVIRKKIVDEEISSDDEETDKNDIGSNESDDEYEDESISESIADDKQLLKTIKAVAQAHDSEESDDDSIEQKEKPTAAIVHRKIAQGTKFSSKEQKTEKLLIYRLHRLTPVCVSFSSDGKYVVSCSKDGSIVKYDLENQKFCKILKLVKNCKEANCHTGHVLCCAVSPDDRYLATAGDDKLIKIWGFHTLDFIQEFKAHRSIITSLVFRKTLAPIELYSGSADRSVKAWNLDQMGFVDTMYGHQYAIQQIDMLSRPRVLTCGGQDRTLRLFKVAEESQLVFNGFADAISIDAVALINEDHFVSGSADGSIYLWSVFKKKPVCVVKKAHGVSKKTGGKDEPNWICSVAACPYTDLVASGSSDGTLRLWRVGDDYKTLAVVDEFPLAGFVNSIRFTDDAKKLACAVGQEHRSGRWWKIKEAKNSIVIIPLMS